MNSNSRTADIDDLEIVSPKADDDLLPLIRGRSAGSPASELFQGVVVGQLIGMRDDGVTPLVTYPGRIERAAVAARSTVDVYRAHLGKEVALVFEGGVPSKPIIIGILRTPGQSSEAVAEQLDLIADGERIVLSAKDQVVFRCGKASITLTKQGKVIIQGAYVSSQSTGVLRIKGGSVQIN